MRALVTGITGFVGGYLAEFLLECGDVVVGCSRRGRWPADLAGLATRSELVACDLCDPRDAQHLIEQVACDTIFHLAGLADPQACRANPDRARRENTDAARNLYEAVRSSARRPRILFVSTAYVYQPPRADQLPVTISSPIRHDHPYGESKWAGEQLSIDYAAYGLDIVRVRAFNHTGPRQSTAYIVPDWAHQFAEMELGRREPRLLVGNLDSRRDYTDVRDVVRAYRLLVEKSAGGAVYNLGSGVSRSGREILDAMRRLVAVHFELEPDATRMRPGEATEIVADATPLEILTGWKPRIDLETTLHDTLQYWRQKLAG